MNHPKHEEWVPYLFGEAKSAERRRLKQHLRDCPECREEVAVWRRSLGQLDAWKLPPAERPRPTFEPVLKWAFAVAVVIVLGAGFAIGRLAPATASVEKVRAALEPGLREQLHQEFAQMLRSELAKTASDSAAAATQALEAKHDEDIKALCAALAKLDARRLADYLALKRDVDTLAVNTDAGLRRADQRLIQFADATLPDAPESAK